MTDTSSSASGEEPAEDRYAVELGERLRRVRAQQRLSLHDVERDSRGEFKASVLGAYERGERAISMARLRRLADFYRVPLTELIPATHAGPHPTDEVTAVGLRIDLTRLDVELPESEALRRFVGAVQARRGDYNRQLITIRRDDLRTLAAVLGLGPGELRARLVGAGVVPEPVGTLQTHPNGAKQSIGQE